MATRPSLAEHLRDSMWKTSAERLAHELSNPDSITKLRLEERSIRELEYWISESEPTAREVVYTLNFPERAVIEKHQYLQEIVRLRKLLEQGGAE